MEQLLHYCWKHRIFPLGELKTTHGQTVEVVDTGLYNTNAGPDFFNAKIKINGTLWVGNIEIHIKSSDWYAHKHQQDAHYNNVILHVASIIDTEIETESGLTIPQIQLEIPQEVASNYKELITTDHYPPCYKIIPTIKPVAIRSWMNALQVERLEQKTTIIRQRLDLLHGDWEATVFATIARNYGFGVNGDAFEQWARALPLNFAGHHRDNLFQIEALFFGQAGLLDPQSITSHHREAALADDYFSRLRAEYAFLAHKFNLKPIDHTLWKFMRMRPQNFPYIRLSQLAQLYFSRQAELSNILNCTNINQLKAALRTSVTDYWKTHYTFGAISKYNEKQLSEPSLQLIIINSIIPILFAYGRYKNNEGLCDRAFNLSEQLPAEDNHIVRMWKECGLSVKNAGDTQALIQLKKEYCDKKDCLRCRIGYEYLKKHTAR